MNRRSRALARLLAVTATAATVALPQPASAEPVSPRANVWIDSWSGNYVYICGEGAVNDGTPTLVRWMFSVTGAVPIEQWPIGPTVEVTAADPFAYCGFFYAGSPPDAAFVVTLTYAGVGVASDIAGVAGLVYEWNTALGHGNQIAFGSNG